MICQDARLLIGAEPDTVSRELAEHLQGCHACSEFRREMTALEANIRRALEQLPVEQPSFELPSGTLHTHRGSRQRHNRVVSAWSGWALAASILVAVVSAFAIWTLHPTESLAHDVVVHVAGEPNSWTTSEQVSAATLNNILRTAGVTLDTGSDRVVYARSCWFRGHYVPHLVVETSRGPVTVLVLRNEHVRERERFHEDGMAGVITPAPHGSIAVLARGDGDIDDVAEQMRKSVRWLPDS
jgi:hypothetical protein